MKIWIFSIFLLGLGLYAQGPISDPDDTDPGPPPTGMAVQQMFNPVNFSLGLTEQTSFTLLAEDGVTVSVQDDDGVRYVSNGQTIQTSGPSILVCLKPFTIQMTKPLRMPNGNSRTFLSASTATSQIPVRVFKNDAGRAFHIGIDASDNAHYPFYGNIIGTYSNGEVITHQGDSFSEQ